jgi:hypothetical protein
LTTSGFNSRLKKRILKRQEKLKTQMTEEMPLKKIDCTARAMLDRKK